MIRIENRRDAGSATVVLVALAALTLAATCYLIASVSKSLAAESDRVAALEKSLDAAQKRGDSIDAVREDLRRIEEKLDEARREAAKAPRGQPLGDVVASEVDRKVVESMVEKRVAERMDAVAARDKERGEDGKWHAPIAELAKELALSDAQKAQAVKAFNHARDETLALLQTERKDGGSLVDDVVEDLKNGTRPGDAVKWLFSRALTERVPDSDDTYFARLVAVAQNVESQLAKQLDAGQMKRLKSLRVDLMDVKTGYDPVGDYVRSRVQ
jgi:hypothetical protein